MFAGFQVPEWKRLGFEYLDELGLKWYDTPPPVRICTVELFDILEIDERTEWMFYWLCYDGWQRQVAYYELDLVHSQHVIDYHFNWGETLNMRLFANMNKAQGKQS
jgi:hypothetical protein